MHAYGYDMWNCCMEVFVICLIHALEKKKENRNNYMHVCNTGIMYVLSREYSVPVCMKIIVREEISILFTFRHLV